MPFMPSAIIRGKEEALLRPSEDEKTTLQTTSRLAPSEVHS
jgi:hypothetical protein